MQIAIDGAGKIWMFGDSVPSGQWNGIDLTVVDLTADQEASFLALPADRDHAIFDGATFTAAPAAVSQNVAQPTIADLQAQIDQLRALLQAKNIVTATDLASTQLSP